MDIALWVVAGLLAAVFLFAGSMKIARTAQYLEGMGPTFQARWSPTAVRLIGTAEVLGAVGLVLPPLVGVLPWLAGVAAVGLAVTMVGAVLDHVTRQDAKNAVAPLVLLLASVFVAWGRLGPYAFGS